MLKKLEERLSISFSFHRDMDDIAKNLNQTRGEDYNVQINLKLYIKIVHNRS